MVKKEVRHHHVKRAVGEWQGEHIGRDTGERAGARSIAEVARTAVERHKLRADVSGGKRFAKPAGKASVPGAHIEDADRAPSSLLEEPLEQFEIARHPAQPAVDLPQVVEAGANLGRRAEVVVQQFLARRAEHIGPSPGRQATAETTNAEFLEPKVMQLQMACSISTSRFS